MSSPPVWLITGCSSGFGARLALLVLRNGHKVIATSRNPSKTPDIVSEVEKLGGKWLALDVCSPHIAAVIDDATKIYGKLDILVNNAAYALLGAFETLSDEDCRAQMETNFFAPMNLTRLVLPAMRQRGSGIIVNISSTAGIEAKPTRSLYSSSKFALEAFSESLYHELKPLGVRVLLVEPGAFRTEFAGNIMTGTELPKEYKGTITEQMMQGVEDMKSTWKAPGDVEKGVKAIFEVLMGQGQGKGMEEVLRLPLGKDGNARWDVKLEFLRKDLDMTQHISEGTDYDD